MINSSDNRIHSATEDRILAAAESEFLQKGFAAARTTAIAEAAGVTHAMLHYYFRTKEKLYCKVIDDKLTTLAQALMINIDDTTSLSDCITEAVSRHFDFVRRNPLLPRFLVSEVFSNEKLMAILTEKLGAFAQSTISILQSKIDRAVADGECGPVDATMLIIDIVSLNVFPVLAAPMVCKVKNLSSTGEFEAFLDSRKEENIRIILSRLFA